ncbi:unnamed protein product [Rangifer tarandus platyrhynchus]|uniref:Uncharacterized protein n=1 Tax=Rangifer tarandus platyrhynchus TaxID=3082113 RepID=A0ABN8Z526_RANTA|nr:unnamed protein product [Rangifer tarandus platyrhynchus]
MVGTSPFISVTGILKKQTRTSHAVLEDYLHILKTAGTVGTALFPSFTAGCPCAPVADTEGEAASCAPRVVSPPRWPRIEAVGMDFGPGAPGGRAWEDAAEGSQTAGPPGAAEPSSTRGTVFERSAFALESARRPSSRDSPVPIPPQRPAGSGADDSLGGGVAGRRWSSPGLGAARPLRRPARGVPAPVPQAPSGVHVALGVTSPLSRAPGPCSVLQAPPSRGDSRACGSAGARSPRGAQGRPARRRPASVPCVPAGPAPSGHGGRSHLCEHEAGSPTEGPAASCTQEPRPPFREQLGTQSTSALLVLVGEQSTPHPPRS